MIELSNQITELYRKAKDGVVRVRQVDADGKVLAAASGTLWTQAGIVLTVSHPFADPGQIEVVHGDDPPARAVVKGWDNRYDLAVLEVPGLSSWTAWSDLEKLNPGEIVFSLGYMEIRMALVARMEESRNNKWGGELKPWVEADGTLSPKQSGGPLVSTEGNFVGVNSLHPGPMGQTLGYGQLQNLVQSILTRGTAKPGFLGVRTSPAKTAEGEGLVITQVDDAGPASNAGLLTGDVILEIGGRRVNSPRQLFMTLRTLNAGDKAEIRIVRSGKVDSVSVELGSRPATEE